MLIVDSLLVSGIKFVLTRVAEAVEAELYDESNLKEELLAAQMKLELGEITEDEFAQIEESVLAGLREIGERKRAKASAASEAARGAPGDGGDAGGAGGAGGAGDAPRKYAIESVSADLEHHEKPEP